MTAVRISLKVTGGFTFDDRKFTRALARGIDQRLSPRFRRICPVKTGRLKRSIGVRMGAGRIDFGGGVRDIRAFYGVYQKEFVREQVKLMRRDLPGIAKEAIRAAI